jgi:site-specific DNA-methyltransferase (adenine-specific)
MVHERKDGKVHEKDEARTPMGLFKNLDNVWHFKIDIACTRINCLCESGIFVNEGHDALKEPWSSYGEQYGDSAYCNPPYSPGNLEPFCKKAYEESLRGAVVVMLLPMDSSTQWFHKYCSKAYKWIIFAPRVTFNHPDGSPFSGSPKFGSFACVFDETGRRPLSSPIVEFKRWK